ncbi:flagellar hook-associated protein FlgK [Romboutsia sp.]|uniref:flagellar hook-associated protein FlgK n=1 Tax=Romboutsia sp. TaxID=1965302 RepID=UPI003F2CEA6C
MAGLLGSLHAAKSGMTVSQTAIQTTSHNINNMNTPGYSRQRVEQSAKSAYSYPGYNSSMGAGQLGTGVEATDIIRMRNTFYDFQFRSESHNYGEIGVKYEHYTTMEKIFNEPSDTSISASINNFFSSWQELSKNPNDSGARDIVIQNSKFLANNISKVKEKLEQLGTQAEKKLNEDIEDINGMLKQLEDLDKHIKIVEGSGKTPNDLLDQRDKIIDDLSFKLNLNDDKVKDALKDGKLELNEIMDKDADGKINIKLNTSGEIQGSLDMINKVNEYENEINKLAEVISKTVNDTLKAPDGSKIELFVYNKDKNPVLQVNEDIINDPKILSVTADVAQGMYKLKDKKVTIDGEEITINNFYNNIVQKLGNETQEVIRNEKNQSKILKDIDNSRLNVSGVSLDEEMVNLVQFQHAYNASAKVISTIDSLLDVVINGLKR